MEKHLADWSENLAHVWRGDAPPVIFEAIIFYEWLLLNRNNCLLKTKPLTLALNNPRYFDMPQNQPTSQATNQLTN